MSTGSDLLPSTRTSIPAWLWLGIGGICLVLPLFALMLPWSPLVLMMLFQTSIYLVQLLLVALVLGILWYLHRHEVQRVADLARSLGLTFHERMQADELAAYTGFVLFRLGEHQRAGFLLEGTYKDRRVLLFEFGYSCKTTSRRKGRGALQTVVLLPDLGLPAFHLAPETNELDDIDPDWARDALVGPEVLEFDSDEAGLVVVRSMDAAAIEKLFRAWRVRLLGEAGDWIVESWHGHLLLYGHARKLRSEHFYHALEHALEVARILTLPGKPGSVGTTCAGSPASIQQPGAESSCRDDE